MSVARFVTPDDVWQTPDVLAHPAAPLLQIVWQFLKRSKDPDLSRAYERARRLVNDELQRSEMTSNQQTRLEVLRIFRPVIASMNDINLRRAYNAAVGRANDAVGISPAQAFDGLTASTRESHRALQIFYDSSLKGGAHK